jgi:hypothetical protein
MDVDLRCFWTAKAGNSADEYEDAFCVSTARDQRRCRPNACSSIGPLSDAGASLRLAIADGASESSFSAVWAKLLVKKFCQQLDGPPVIESAASESHHASAVATLHGFDRASAIWKRCYGARSMPWYAEQKRDMGAYAAFLGLEFCLPQNLPEGGRWSATAIGDACMFQFRHGSLIAAFPIDDAEAFTQSPWLFASREPAAVQAEHLRQLQGEWRAGDEFLLLTDAAACWLLQGLQLRDADPLGFIRSLRTQREFDEWVAGQRSDIVNDHPRLRNDDVTLIWCSISAEDSRGALR